MYGFSGLVCAARLKEGTRAQCPNCGWVSALSMVEGPPVPGRSALEEMYLRAIGRVRLFVRGILVSGGAGEVRLCAWAEILIEIWYLLRKSAV